jgi:hypothetical protein
MKIIANCNFLWYVKGQEVPESDYRENWKEFVTITGEASKAEPIKVMPVVSKPVTADLNNDGKVDKEDAKIAGEVLRKVYPNKKRK